MPVKRLTKQNPQNIAIQKVTYHIPMHWIEGFEMKTFGSNTYLYGEIPQKLGKYEDLGEPEEIARKLGLKPDWMK